ncbi:MAG TPA: MATE family efflux transporter, partial [Gammaproteobacteria bacterium]|nr:MATE family efflux transporter [Gammaproteobacteria bacterium]
MPSRDLTQGSVTRSLAQLTAPMMMGVSSSILVQTLELGFIGQLGTEQVAAVSFTFPLVMVLSSIALGISIGTSSVIARSVGVHRQAEPDSSPRAPAASDEVARLGTHSLILVAVTMTVLSLLCWLMIDPLFLAMGAEPSLLPLIHSYLDIYLPGSILFTLAMVAGSIMRANGRAAIPGVIMTVGAAFNLALDPFLIFGW